MPNQGFHLPLRFAAWLRNPLRFTFVVTLWTGLAGQNPAPPTQITGFSPAHVSPPKPSWRSSSRPPSRPDRIRDYHRYFTSKPHPAGTKNDYEVAQYIADGMEKARTGRRRHPPVRRAGNPARFNHAGDGCTEKIPRQCYASSPTRSIPTPKTPRSPPPGSASPPVAKSPLPWCTRTAGIPRTTNVLRKNGIDVKGKIVLVRYSNPYSYRGFKALTAQRMGAAALLIYSDPAEDGYKKGKVFPDGPWGPESHIQRGAITYDFMVPGDPLTPGWASLSRRQTYSRERSRLPAAHHRAASLLARCQATAGEHGRSRRSQRLAGRTAYYLSPRRLGDRASESRDGQLDPALLCRGSPHQR